MARTTWLVHYILRVSGAIADRFDHHSQQIMRWDLSFWRIEPEISKFL
ncbi:MAG: hypothetical protein QNJ63_10940 [Calothrix sp. MO_192.B10]|nr:hypothetical protein [Calothrix sp. MO_192.B10]